MGIYAIVFIDCFVLKSPYENPYTLPVRPEPVCPELVEGRRVATKQKRGAPCGTPRNYWSDQLNYVIVI